MSTGAAPTKAIEFFPAPTPHLAASTAPEDLFSVSVSRANPYDQERIVVCGELDRCATHLFESAVELVLTRWGIRPQARSNSVSLDLSGVTFVDLGGIDAMRRAHQQVRGRGADLHVVPPSAGGPRRLLQLAADHGWLAGAFAPHPLTQPKPVQP